MVSVASRWSTSGALRRKRSTSRSPISSIRRNKSATCYYLVPNYDVLSYLTGIFMATPVRLWFGMVRDWHSQLLSMPVVDASSPVPRQLFEALQLPRFNIEAP